MNVLDVIGDPELRETLLEVRGRPRAASISEIADATGVHRNVARRRLERLVAAGLLTASFERPPGRSGPGAGRPAKVYSPTPDTTAIEFPARRYPELVGLLVDAVPAAAAVGDRGAVRPRAGLDRRGRVGARRAQGARRAVPSTRRRRVPGAARAPRGRTRRDRHANLPPPPARRRTTPPWRRSTMRFGAV